MLGEAFLQTTGQSKSSEQLGHHSTLIRSFMESPIDVDDNLKYSLPTFGNISTDSGILITC